MKADPRSGDAGVTNASRCTDALSLRLIPPDTAGLDTGSSVGAGSRESAMALTYAKLPERGHTPERGARMVQAHPAAPAHLPRLLGNAAVGQLLTGRTRSADRKAAPWDREHLAKPAAQLQRVLEQEFGTDLSRVRAADLSVPAASGIGAEHAADRFAIGGPPPAPAADAGPVPGTAAKTARAGVEGEGFPLPLPVRAPYEARLGLDLSDVHVHTGPEAVGAAHALQARAYTFGSDIAFGRGQYQPLTPVGSRLLAHELAHTVQQRFSPPVVARAPNPRTAAYGDPALDQAAAGDLPAVLGWLGGQSMTALIAILKRARARDLLPALLTGLTGDQAHLGPAGVKRIEAAIRAVQFQAQGPTGSDRMQLVLLMDAAALPVDQRAELEALLRRPGAAVGDGLEAKLAEGEFGTAFAMLNGMSMAGMLSRLSRLGRAWHTYLVANVSAADSLGPHSRARIEIALVAADRAMVGRATADDLLQLKSRMTEIGLPSDQQQEVLAAVPRARGGDAESIAGYFENVGLAPLLLPWAVARSFRLLDGRTPEQIALTGEKVSEEILRALVSHSRQAEVHDAEAIRQGLQRAWTSRFPATPPPWDVGRPATVADMSAADKLVKALDATLRNPHLGPQYRARLQELKTPESIAMMATFTTVYVASQLTPAGWVADVLVGGLVVAGLVMGGMEALEIIRHIAAFMSTALNASSESDFDSAADHLAIAVTKLTVDVVVGILLHRVGTSTIGVIKRALASPGLPGLNLGLVTPDGMVIPDLPPETLQTKGGGAGSPKKTTAPVGGQVLFETTRADGTTVIRSRVGRPSGRRGTENLLPSSVEVDVPGWERAHSQGNITGAESARGIRYAPKEVNQKLQKLGIEQAIRDLFAQKASDVDVIMTTETRAHPGSLRLAKIAYRIDLKKPNGASLRVYEAAIEIENTTSSPRCDPTVDPIGWALLESDGWLKTVPSKP
ncbi:DUF4157 domain-containing protein [Streptomyces sp. NPDC056512]|uniref:eCIS core domain-containing protein n=1 Tax=Streptomyces sp. NPDC056512 TaxID=3345846 RepID=UPI0036B01F3E